MIESGGRHDQPDGTLIINLRVFSLRPHCIFTFPREFTQSNDHRRQSCNSIISITLHSLENPASPDISFLDHRSSRSYSGSQILPMAVPMYHIDAPVVDELPFDIFDLASIHPSSYVTLQEFRSRIKKLALKLHPDKATTTGLGIHQPPANGAYPSMTVLTAILDYFKHRSDWSFGEHRYFWDMHTRSTMNSQAILDGVADPRIIFSPAPNWPESERPYFMP